MLYCSVKTGVFVNIADLGFNVLYDLINYSAEIDALALSKAEGKNISYSAPLNLAEMTKKGQLRG